MVLERIKAANDIKKIPPEEYEALAREIREFLIEKVSKTGGHLASNLGVVELTMALHIALDLPKDKIVWDVGHQAYVHKILTGRAQGFDTLRQKGGLAGFPKVRESVFDTFNTGHASTSIAAALGLAQAAVLSGDDSTIVAVIGDGSLTGGLAFEGLNNLSRLKRNLIIILNDNNMSISHNVGGLSSYLSSLRAGKRYNNMKLGTVNFLSKIPGAGKRIVKSIRKTKSSFKQLFVPGMMFENMDITYLGPVSGYNIKKMVKLIEQAKSIDHAVLIHVFTDKGKGYAPAENEPERFHGIGAFDPETGECVSGCVKKTYSDVFSEELVRLAGKDKKITAITAAMEDGVGLSAFRKKYPERFFDVGIAEECAVTFAAGLSAAGYKPFVAIYSSFLQRAYDQIMHDVCMQNLPVVFMIDRAGFVGNDGETHQGLFDISYLMSIPNMNILAPGSAEELKAAVDFAAGFNKPLAIRYPRGGVCGEPSKACAPIEYGKSEVLYREKDIALFALGSTVSEAKKAREILKSGGHNVTLINARFAKPLDEELIGEIIKTHRFIFTAEENIQSGGFGTALLSLASSLGFAGRVVILAAPNQYIEQAGRDEQIKECGLTGEQMAERIKAEVGF